MYYLYKATREGNLHHFKKVRQIPLAGSRNGIIVRYLRTILPEGQNESYLWHIASGVLLRELELDADKVVLDVNPNSQSEINLHELLDVWGYSESDWTPILLRLREIVNVDKTQDQSYAEFHKDKFHLPNYQGQTIVWTILYMRGSVAGGE